MEFGVLLGAGVLWLLAVPLLSLVLATDVLLTPLAVTLPLLPLLPALYVGDG